MDKYAEIIGRNVRNFLHNSKMTQAEFGVIAGLEQPVISRVVNNKLDNPRYETLAAIAEACGESVPWLLTDNFPARQNAAEFFRTPLEKEILTRLEAIERKLRTPEEQSARDDFAEHMAKAYLTEAIPEHRIQAEKSRHIFALLQRMTPKQVDRYIELMEADLGLTEEQKQKIKRSSL